MSFTPIETQEQFDAAIKDRLQRDRDAQAKKYEGWTSPEDLQKVKDGFETRIKALEDAAAETAQQMAAKDEEIAKGENYRTDLAKTRIAIKAGLKIDYVDRIKGETEEEWKQDAEQLAKDFAAAHITAPIGNPGVTNTDTHDPEALAKAKFGEWFKEIQNQ